MPRLTRKIPEPPPTLQELLDPPEHISQAILREYLRLADARDEARDNLQAAASEITDKLLHGFPVESGSLSAELLELGQLRVDWRRR